MLYNKWCVYAISAAINTNTTFYIMIRHKMYVRPPYYYIVDILLLKPEHLLNGHDIFESVEKRISRYFRMFVQFTLVSYTAYVTMPGLSQFLVYRSGLATSATYSAPFHDLWVN